MSDNKNNNPPEREQSDTADSNLASSEVSSVVGSVKTSKVNGECIRKLGILFFTYYLHDTDIARTLVFRFAIGF